MHLCGTISKGEMLTITICTDAGYKKLYKQSCAAWAAYIRTPHQTIKVSGIIRQRCKGSSQAELYAVANALHIVGREYDLSKYRIILYSDNKYALKNHIDKTITKSAGQDFCSVYDKYIRPHIDKAYIYEARWVKAHLPSNKWGSSSAKHFMQNWCDTEVQRVRKVAEQQIIKKKLGDKYIDKTACVLK
jgi:hypothetical protein